MTAFLLPICPFSVSFCNANPRFLEIVSAAESSKWAYRGKRRFGRYLLAHCLVGGLLMDGYANKLVWWTFEQRRLPGHQSKLQWYTDIGNWIPRLHRPRSTENLMWTDFSIFTMHVKSTCSPHLSPRAVSLPEYDPVLERGYSCIVFLGPCPYIHLVKQSGMSA